MELNKISRYEAVFIFAIQNKISRYEACQIIEKEINKKKIYTADSTNMNDICEESVQNNYLYKKYFDFLYNVFNLVELSYINEKEGFNLSLKENLINENINKEKLIDKINKFINNLKITVSINKTILDNKDSFIKQKFNTLVLDALEEINDINKEFYNLSSANSKVYLMEDGDVLYMDYSRFNFIDLFKINESNNMVKLNEDEIMYNIENKLKKISIISYLTNEEINDIKIEILRIINDKG